MLKAEVLDSWNEIFPDCKIKEKDLAKPTMAFLVKALIRYLQKFGYNVNSPSSQEFDLTSLIKIVRHIDHILKITDKTYSFTYFDLIDPSPKKTTSMLGILLNYLYFFNMYKTEVFTKANEAINARNELLSRVQQAEEENQQLEIKAQKIKEEMTLYTEKLPKADAELLSVTERKMEQQEEIKKLEDQLRDATKKLEDLQLHKRNLKKRIVPDTEAQELKLQLQTQKAKIAEQNTLEATTKNSVKELAQSIKSIQNLLKDIEETKDLLPMRQLETLKDVEKTFLETKNATIVSQKNNTAILEQIQLMQDEIKQLEENYKEQQRQFEQEKISVKKNHNKIETELQENINRIENLRHEEECLDNACHEQQEIILYLQENISNLMDQFKI